MSKAIDKAAGAEREVVEQVRVKGGGTEYLNRSNNETHDYRPGAYQKGENVLDVTAPSTDAAKQYSGYGTALKPAWEIIAMARKPLVGTVANNVQKHGTGAINIDGCRIPLNGDYKCGANGRPSQTGLTAKASKSERNGSKHPTVKPISLMRYLVRLLRPPDGGVVLDPFSGSGTTAEACIREQINCIAIEREAEYVEDIVARISKTEFDQKTLW